MSDSRRVYAGEASVADSSVGGFAAPTLGGRLHIGCALRTEVCCPESSRV